MKVKQIDTYITSTQSLLKSNPSGTTITITYTHSKSKSKKNDGKDNLKTIIKFKTFEPRTGICHNYKTHKIKEFSKLFNALGPRGCNIEGKDIDGLSLLLANSEKADVVKEEEIAASTAASAVQGDAGKTQNTHEAPVETTQKKKNKKKKGKK